jgi:hypothetical protein
MRKISHFSKGFVVIMASVVMVSCATGLEALTETCDVVAVVVPTLPVFIPDEFELDPTTNLHKSGTPQIIDLETYRLEVTGLVDNPLSLTYNLLRCLPKITDTPTLVCPQTFLILQNGPACVWQRSLNWPVYRMVLPMCA